MNFGLDTTERGLKRITGCCLNIPNWHKRALSYHSVSAYGESDVVVQPVLRTEYIGRTSTWTSKTRDQAEQQTRVNLINGTQSPEVAARGRAGRTCCGTISAASSRRSAVCGPVPRQIRQAASVFALRFPVPYVQQPQSVRRRPQWYWQRKRLQRTSWQWRI